MTLDITTTVSDTPRSDDEVARSWQTRVGTPFTDHM